MIMEILSSCWNNLFLLCYWCVFSGAFPSLAFACFLLTKLMSMWGSGGKKWGLQVIQAGPATESWRDFQNVGHTVAGTAG